MMPGQPMPQGAPQAPDAGGDLGSKIRQAALGALSPPELQILEQAITPQFIQVMAKLYGDQAVVLLGPLVNLQSGMQQEGQFSPPGQSAGGALNQFSAPDAADQNYQPPQMMGNLGMGSGGNQPCPGCNDENCPDCQSRTQTPTSVMFGRR